MAVRIRPLHPEEWRTWRSLRLRALTEAPDAFGETLAGAQAKDEAGWMAATAHDPSRRCLVAERDGIPVGMTVVVINRTRADLYAMWVAPEARGGGVGRALVAEALRGTRSNAVLELKSHVSERQPAAKRLYEAAGFVPTGERVALRDGSAVLCDVMVARQSPLIMGVVNITPNSFSDGFANPVDALEHAFELLDAGADIIDVGGEATNPRAAAVGVEVELERVIAVIEQLAEGKLPISIDTTKAAVARAAVAAGATIINDISGGLFDPGMAAAVAELGVTYIAGHLRGRSLNEVFAAEHGLPWQTVADELSERLAALAGSVVAWVDPGIGFGKGPDPEGNLELLRHAGDISRAVDRPIVVGPSRKRFLRSLLGGDPDLAALDVATVAASLAAVRAGAHVVRAHNVALLRTALTVYTKV